jgi:hypothetical protein
MYNLPVPLFRHTSIPAGEAIATQEVSSKTRHTHHQVVNIIYRRTNLNINNAVKYMYLTYGGSSKDSLSIITT